MHKLAILSILSFALSIASRCLAADIMLRISVVDGIALRGGEIDDSSAALRRAYPDRRLISIRSKKSNRYFLPGAPGRESRRVHDEIVAATRTLKLGPDDRITTIYIDTHGSDRGQSNLADVGSFTDEGPDASFREIFDPIRTQVSGDVELFLNACSTICGPDAQAARRARSLFQYFNAPNATLVAARNYVIAGHPAEQNLSDGIHREPALGNRIKSPVSNPSDLGGAQFRSARTFWPPFKGIDRGEREHFPRRHAHWENISRARLDAASVVFLSGHTGKVASRSATKRDERLILSQNCNFAYSPPDD